MRSLSRLFLALLATTSCLGLARVYGQDDSYADLAPADSSKTPVTLKVPDVDEIPVSYALAANFKEPGRNKIFVYPSTVFEPRKGAVRSDDIVVKNVGEGENPLAYVEEIRRLVEQNPLLKIIHNVAYDKGADKVAARLKICFYPAKFEVHLKQAIEHYLQESLKVDDPKNYLLAHIAFPNNVPPRLNLRLINGIEMNPADRKSGRQNGALK